MPLPEFTSLLYKNLGQYILILIITGSIYYIFLRKYMFSIFDTLFFNNIVSSTCATSTVVFLFMQNKIRPIYFYNYLITVIIFWCIFMIFGKKIPIKNCVKFKYSTIQRHFFPIENFYPSKNFYIFFQVFAILNVLIQLFFYLKTGIPLFMRSRLEVTLNGGMLVALLSRIRPLISVTSTFMVYYVIAFEHRYKKLFGKIYLVCLLTFVMLSGSRSGLFSFIFSFAVFVYLTQYYNRTGINLLTNPKFFIFLVFCLFITIGIIAVQSKGNLANSFAYLFVRFTAYGDPYIYGYVNDNFLKVTKLDLLNFIFGDFLQTFRLSTIRRNIGFGFELNNIVYNVTDSVGGPNSRFNLITYSYFGFFGSIISAVVCGGIFTLTRNLLISAVDKTPKFQIISYFFYSICSSVETEPISMISSLTTNLFIQICVFTCLSFFILYSIPKQGSISLWKMMKLKYQSLSSHIMLQKH